MIGIDMKMPKSCITCHFFILGDDENEECLKAHNFSESAISFRCGADTELKRINSKDELLKRHSKCPLIKLTEGERK